MYSNNIYSSFFFVLNIAYRYFYMQEMRLIVQLRCTIYYINYILIFFSGTETDFHPDIINIITETTNAPQLSIFTTTINVINEKMSTTPAIYNSTVKHDSTIIGNKLKSSSNSNEITEVNIIIILISSLIGLFITIIIIMLIIWLSRKYRCCLKKSGYIDADELQNRPEIPVRYHRPINPSYVSVRASSKRGDSLKPIDEGEEEHIYDVIKEFHTNDVIGEPIYDDVGPPGS